MNEETEHDWLDRKLQEAAPYIEDDGFTARVLQQLPARRGRAEFLRPLILVTMSSLASALTYVLSDGARFIVVDMFKLTTIPTLWLFVLAFGTGLFIMFAGLVAAMSKTSDLRS